MTTIIVGGRGPHPSGYLDDIGEFGDDLEWAPPPMAIPPISRRAVPMPMIDVYELSPGDQPPPGYRSQREDEALDEANISELGLGRGNGQKFGGMVAIGLGVGILVIFSLLLTRKQ